MHPKILNSYKLKSFLGGQSSVYVGWLFVYLVFYLLQNGIWHIAINIYK